MLKKSRIKAKITIGDRAKTEFKRKKKLATAAGDTISYQLAMLHQYFKFVLFVYFMKVL